MFDLGSSRLGEVFENLKRRGALSSSDVDAALRDVRSCVARGRRGSSCSS